MCSNIKKYFDGRETPRKPRIVNSQKQLERMILKIGFTARHHTFFEMLGNFLLGTISKRSY